MENLKYIIVGAIILVIAFFAGDAFTTLVGDMYRFLDSYIWAFFAGIMAFFIALWVVVIMVYITIAIVALIAGLLSMFLK